jgi:hypothetical protein
LANRRKFDHWCSTSPKIDHRIITVSLTTAGVHESPSLPTGAITLDSSPLASQYFLLVHGNLYAISFSYQMHAFFSVWWRACSMARSTILWLFFQLLFLGRHLLCPARGLRAVDDDSEV